MLRLRHSPSDSIHDTSTMTTPLETETDSSFDVMDSSSESGHSSTTKEHHFGRRGERADLSSRAEESSEERSNFYPITWRVIGGGVMMSGPRESLYGTVSCDNVRTQ